MKPSEFLLFSGGLRGAEAAFGAAAERHGVEEVNLTFEGHAIERTRGVRTLTQEELKQGDVSLEYVAKLLNRHFPKTDYFKRVLQTIWHQVNSAQEIFVIGKILADATVKGGTGWGAEFGKICNKPLYVFDQDEDSWRHWTGSAWEAHAAPRITQAHFTGTGTRHLRDNGRAAIDKLFADTFAR